MDVTVHARRQDDTVVNARVSDLEKVQAWLKRGWNEIFMVMTDVSPSLASCLMEKNAGNRALVTAGKGTRNSRTYAEAMVRGEWVINGETIVVASTGELNDGQHRLFAVIKSGVTVPMLIVFGVERETRHTLDQGIARSASQVLSMYGEKNATNLATGLRLLFQMEHPAQLNARPSTDEMMAVLEANPKIREPALREAWRLNALFQTSVGTIGAAYYLTLEHNRPKAEQFYETVVTGLGMTNQNDPVAKLRSMYIDHYARKDRQSATEHAANYIRAYNAWLEGKPFRPWRAKQGVPFPRPGKAQPLAPDAEPEPLSLTP